MDELTRSLPTDADDHRGNGVAAFGQTAARPQHTYYGKRPAHQLVAYRSGGAGKRKAAPAGRFVTRTEETTSNGAGAVSVTDSAAPATFTSGTRQSLRRHGLSAVDVGSSSIPPLPMAAAIPHKSDLAFSGAAASAAEPAEGDTGNVTLKGLPRQRRPTKSLKVNGLPDACQGDGEEGWSPAILAYSTIGLNGWLSTADRGLTGAQIALLKKLRRRIKNRRYTKQARTNEGGK